VFRLFYFLSECFFFPPADPRRSEIWEIFCSVAKNLNLSVPTLNGLDEEFLKTEYTRLFISAPFGTIAPPYASVYLSSEGLLFQRGHDEALSFYEQAGLRLEERGEPADHLAFELAFVGHLLEERKERLLEAFLRKHLLRWYPAFHRRLLAAEPHPYFEFLARLTGEVLQKLFEEVSYEEKTIS